MNRVVILDFDETITVKDTIRCLVESAIDLQRQASPQSCKLNYKIIEDYYLQTYANIREDSTAHLSASVNLLFKNQAVTQKYLEEYQYQAWIRQYEYQTLRNLENLHVFDGIWIPDLIRHTVPKITVRPGFNDFLNMVLPGVSMCNGNKTDAKSKTELYILSLNFSKELIHNFVPPIKEENIFCDYLKKLENLGREPHSVYTGELDGGIITGSDKCDRIFAITGDSTTPSHDSNENWYIGDSRSDYLSILHPNINRGIIICDDDNKLEKCCTFFQITPEYGDITSRLIAQKWLPDPKPSMKIKPQSAKTVHVVKAWQDIIDLFIQDKL